MKRDAVDFFVIPSEQTEMHKRCLNWRRWCEPRHYSAVQPMFLHYRPYLVPREPSCSEPVDVVDALSVQKGYTKLPPKHQAAIHWYYFIGRSPRQVAQKLGVNPRGLLELVNDARLMLKNTCRQRLERML